MEKSAQQLMITGRLYDEATVLRVALAYERATTWHTMNPPLDENLKKMKPTTVGRTAWKGRIGRKEHTFGRTSAKNWSAATRSIHRDTPICAITLSGVRHVGCTSGCRRILAFSEPVPTWYRELTEVERA